MLGPFRLFLALDGLCSYQTIWKNLIFSHEIPSHSPGPHVDASCAGLWHDSWWQAENSNVFELAPRVASVTLNVRALWGKPPQIRHGPRLDEDGSGELSFNEADESICAESWLGQLAGAPRPRRAAQGGYQLRGSSGFRMAPTASESLAITEACLVAIRVALMRWCMRHAREGDSASSNLTLPPGGTERASCSRVLAQGAPAMP